MINKFLKNKFHFILIDLWESKNIFKIYSIKRSNKIWKNSGATPLVIGKNNKIKTNSLYIFPNNFFDNKTIKITVEIISSIIRKGNTGNDKYDKINTAGIPYIMP